MDNASLIKIEPDKTVQGATVYAGGDLAQLGPTLVNHYSNSANVNGLIAKHQLRTVGASPEKSPSFSDVNGFSWKNWSQFKHSFYHSNDLVYHLDNIFAYSHGTWYLVSHFDDRNHTQKLYPKTRWQPVQDILLKRKHDHQVYEQDASGRSIVRDGFRKINDRFVQYDIINRNGSLEYDEHALDWATESRHDLSRLYPRIIDDTILYGNVKGIDSCLVSVYKNEKKMRKGLTTPLNEDAEFRRTHGNSKFFWYQRHMRNHIANTLMATEFRDHNWINNILRY